MIVEWNEIKIKYGKWRFTYKNLFYEKEIKWVYQ